VKGTIKASERIELLSGAELEGQVQTPVLVVAEGSRFNGHCQVARPNKVINVVIDGDRLDESAAQLQDQLKTSTGRTVAQPDKKK
jgi:cytoskeletal protein CcmA (bactofilin family)